MNRHAALERVLLQLGLGPEAPPDPATWARLLAALDTAFGNSDQDRLALERSLAQSNREMKELYDELKQRSESALLAERDKLRASEERYALAARGANDGLWDWDLRTGEVYLSPRWKSQLGFAEEELASSFDVFLDLLHPKDHAKVHEAIRRHLEEREPYDLELRFRQKGGGWRWIRARGQAVWDDGGQALRMAGSHTDITFQKEAEAAVRASGERFRTLVENVPGAVFRARNDAAFSVVFMSENIRDIAGHSAADFMAGRIRLQDLIHPADLPKVISTLSEALVLRQTYQLEYRIVDKAGRERWVYGQGQGVIAEDGTMPFLDGLILDVTTHHASQEAVQQAQRQLVDAIESLDAGFAMFDAEDRLITCNGVYRAFYSDVAPLLVPGTPYEAILRGFLERIPASEFQAGPEAWLAERLASHRNPGVVAEHLVRGRWIRSSDQRTSEGGLVSLRMDVTALKEQQEELRRAKEAAEAATRAKSQFLANMSHEIRTPMNGVLGMTGFLLETPLTPEQREYAQTVRSCAEGLLEIINDILDFSKIEAGKLDLAPIPFDLQELLEQTLAMFTPRALDKGIELLGALDPRLPVHLVGDPGRVRQILVNLLGNALKFTERGTVQVRFSLERQDDQEVSLHVEVQDSGIGIPPEAQDRLFRSFSQADTSMARRFGGTGLGLVISRNLVQLMGGEIGVHSEPGLGSTFWFTLRLPRDPDPPAPPEPLLAGHRVLLVAAAGPPQTLLQRNLEGLGLVVEAAGSLEEAEAALAATPLPFKALLVDLPSLPPGAAAWAAASAARRPTLSLHAHLQDPTRTDLAGRPLRRAQLHTALAVLLGYRPSGDTVDLDAPPPPLAGPRGRLLVAEDNPVNQKVILRTLDRLGYQADVVANGLEALAALRHLPYDLVLMDCQMPEMDGFEATAALRREEAATGRHLPVVALTAHAMAGERERCLAAGMDDYTTKPLQVPELKRILQSWVDERRAAPPPVAVVPVAAAPAPNGILDPGTLAQLRELDEGGTGLLAEMFQLFCEDVPPRLDQMREALAAGDAKALGEVAHALKGASGSMGATALRHLCADLEKAGREHRLEDAALVLPRVVAAYGEARAALQAHLEG